MDFDADGKLDLLSGGYPGKLYFFKGKGGDAFEKAEQIKHADGKPVKQGLAAVVYAHDWDADGDLDLLVGDIEGQVHLVPNEGSKSKPAFGQASLLKVGNAPIKVPHGDAGPTVADWDGDGKFDLIVGAGDGAVVWHRNTGTEKAPALAAAETLVEAPKADAPAPRRGTRAKAHAVDWNKDGKLDLLVGDFAYQEAPAPVLSPEQQAQQKEKRQAWMNEYAKLQQAPLDETPEARKARMKHMAELVAKFKELNAAQEAAAPQQPAYHGYVWLFLRQDGVAAAQ